MTCNAPNLYVILRLMLQCGRVNAPPVLAFFLKFGLLAL